jgi:hypothetical protein
MLFHVHHCKKIHYILSHFLEVMFKTCQHGTNEIKMGVGMKEMSLIDVQVVYYKIITWTKKSQKGVQEWEGDGKVVTSRAFKNWKLQSKPCLFSM